MIENWRFDDDSIEKDHEEENDVYMSKYSFSRMLIKWKKRRVAYVPENVANLFVYHAMMFSCGETSTRC